jgi:hypothetical protein
MLIIINMGSFKDNPSIIDQGRIIGTNVFFGAVLAYKRLLRHMGIEIKNENEK